MLLEEKQKRKEERKKLKREKEHRIIYDIDHKKCAECKSYKPSTREYFYENKKNTIDWLHNLCKECEIQKAKQWAKDNKEQHNENNRKAFKENRWDIKNIIRENSKERRLQGKHKEWQQNNTDKMKKYNENRRHKNHNINDEEWKSCLRYFNNKCAYCGLKAEDHYNMYRGELRLESLQKEHVDHEGKNDLSNCVPACKSCNDRKWKFEFEEWYNKDNERYSQEKNDKIIKWINEDYKQYIKPPKPKGKYTRKKIS